MSDTEAVDAMLDALVYLLRCEAGQVEDTPAARSATLSAHIVKLLSCMRRRKEG